jgi:hypothetical protein
MRALCTGIMEKRPARELAFRRPLAVGPVWTRSGAFPMPELSSHSRPSYERGACGIDSLSLINPQGAVALATASSPIHTSRHQLRTTEVKSQIPSPAPPDQQTPSGESYQAGVRNRAPSPERRSRKEAQDGQWSLRSQLRFASGVLAEPRVIGAYQELPSGAHRCLAPTPIEVVRYPSPGSKNRQA